MGWATKKEAIQNTTTRTSMQIHITMFGNNQGHAVISSVYLPANTNNISEKGMKEGRTEERD